MEKEEQEEEEAALLSRVDSQVLRQQSQWLQTILFDLDTKINSILSIIVQDDGDTFAKRAEMYYQKRPELVRMVEELQKSYRLLAEKYDQLRSQGMQNHVHSNGMFTAAESTETSNLKPSDEEKNNVTAGTAFQRNMSDGTVLMENEKLWNELRFEVSELVEDNLSHQDELIKRNENGKTSELSHEVPAKRTRPPLSWLKRLFCGRSMKSDAS